MTTPTPLTTTFPPRMKPKPPSSGGFYEFKKTTRTVDEEKNNDIDVNSSLLVGREKIKPGSGNYRQFFKSQIALEEEKLRLDINEDDDVYSDYEENEEDIEYRHFDKKKVAPALTSSFSSILPATKMRSEDVKHVEAQTQFTLQKEIFPTLTDYQVWIQTQVDPLLTVSQSDCIALCCNCIYLCYMYVVGFKESYFV